MLFHRHSLVLCAALAALPAAPAWAQAAYPSRPVRVIVPSAPGGGTDILTRRITPAFSRHLGQQVIVDNRGGAATIIGNDLAAHATPDGYTLLMGLSTLTILPSIRKELPYDALKDLAPITMAVAAPNILVVHPSLPVKSVKELIAFGRAHSGELNYASAGIGSNPHLSMALFLNMTGIKMVHITYKGLGPALVDVISGQVVVMFGTMLSSLRHVKSGRLRGLATTGLTRSSALPDLPTVDQAGVKGYHVAQWYGLLAPAGTPAPAIGVLNKAMVAALRDEKQKFAVDGVETVGDTPEEFRRALETELAKWAKVAQAAGIKRQ
jgi:tripartite-type tricarboxylate transporter receptor subunit TctC